MQRANWGTRRIGRIVVAGIVALGAAASGGIPLRAQGLTVEGSWSVRVTVTDCVNFEPLPSPPAPLPFYSLVTFHRDGSIIESSGAPGFAPDQRSVGHGTWTHGSAGTVEQNTVGLIVFETQPNLPGTSGFNPALPVTPGFQAGWQVIRHHVTLNRPDQFTSKGTSEFYNLAGQLYRTGCSTAVAERLD